jgi:hypothetical protein
MSADASFMQYTLIEIVSRSKTRSTHLESIQPVLDKLVKTLSNITSDLSNEENERAVENLKIIISKYLQPNENDNGLATLYNTPDNRQFQSLITILSFSYKQANTWQQNSNIATVKFAALDTISPRLFQSLIIERQKIVFRTIATMLLQEKFNTREKALEVLIPLPIDGSMIAEYLTALQIVSFQDSAQRNSPLRHAQQTPKRRRILPEHER